MNAESTFHVFCGAETGLLKGVNTAKKTFVNLNKSADLSRSDEITTLRWANPEESRIHCALRKQIVATRDAQTGLLLRTVDVKAGEGPIKGLETLGEAIVTCSQSGAFRVWQSSDEGTSARLELDVGPDVFRMRQNPFSAQEFATGGRENELKLWDLNKPEKALFVAKNVRNDHLDLRVPVWVTDFRFWDDSKLIIGTGYNKIRVYDTKCGQRRPVAEMGFDEYPITCLSLAGERSPQSVLVGNTHGRVALFDIRKQRIVHAFKGFAGSVRAIEVHPSKPYVVSCGLDRILRVHDFERHVLLSKIYLKSRLTSLLLRTTDGKHSIHLEGEEDEKQQVKNTGQSGVTDAQNSFQLGDEQAHDGNDSDDQLWDNMGVMKEDAESGIESDESVISHEPERRKRQRQRRTLGSNSSGNKKIRSTTS